MRVFRFEEFIFLYLITSYCVRCQNNDLNSLFSLSASKQFDVRERELVMS